MGKYFIFPKGIAGQASFNWFQFPNLQLLFTIGSAQTEQLCEFPVEFIVIIANRYNIVYPVN